MPERRVIIKELIDNIDTVLVNSKIINWASPIISFGDVMNCEIATVGINPSNIEFLNNDGIELKGHNLRLQTLNSLNLKNWNNTDNEHLDKILDYSNNYFTNNPYDKWFKRLDNLWNAEGYSYYFPSSNVCHLDLVPYATYNKWGELSANHKEQLLMVSKNILGNILNESSIRTIILNGQSVVDGIQSLTNKRLTKEDQPEWNIKHNNNKEVRGYSYKGYIDNIGDIEFDKPILVLGYNHNIQSSYGLTKGTINQISEWIISNI